jgi:hypothetical protein
MDYQSDTNSHRANAVGKLVVDLDQNDSQYLGGEIERETWLERAHAIDDKLTVIGLRLVTRPWAQNAR